jgi:hypothetical protein
MLAKGHPRRYVNHQMDTYRARFSSEARREQVVIKASTQPQYQQFRLAMDVHAASIVVFHMTEGAKLQPPQTLKLAGLLAWVRAE